MLALPRLDPEKARKATLVGTIIGVLIAAIVLGVSVMILEKFQTTMNTNSTAYETTSSVMSYLHDFGPLLILITLAGAIIAVILGVFRGRE